MRLEEFYQENDEQKELRRMVEVLEQKFPKLVCGMKINRDRKKVSFTIEKTIEFNFRYNHRAEKSYTYSVVAEKDVVSKVNKICKGKCSNLTEAITKAKNGFYNKLETWKSRVSEE
jgi:hypothetical protein